MGERKRVSIVCSLPKNTRRKATNNILLWNTCTNQFVPYCRKLWKINFDIFCANMCSSLYTNSYKTNFIRIPYLVLKLYLITSRFQDVRFRWHVDCQLRNNSYVAFPGCQRASYLVLSHIKQSTCRFLVSFLKIASTVKVLKSGIELIVGNFRNGAECKSVKIPLILNSQP